MADLLSPLQTLVHLAQEDLSRYGPKTAGVVDLMRAAADSTHAYNVPSGFAMPADSYTSIPEDGFRRVYNKLTQPTLDGRGVLLVRDSALDPTPGKYSTHFVAYDAQQAEKGYASFRNAIAELGSASDSMGILIMPMVGGLSILKDVGEVVGLDGVGFVAETHSPTNPSEMSIALVNGLATRAVAQGSDAIVVTVDRETLNITSFGNRAMGLILHGALSQAPSVLMETYRQQKADVFSFKKDGVLSVPLILPNRRGRKHTVINGKLKPSNPETEYGSDLGYIPVGLMPFEVAAPLVHLIGILQYFASHSSSPLQIEGAFPDQIGEVPFLFQRLDVPLPPLASFRLDPEGADYLSRRTVGVCDARMPLVCMENPRNSILLESSADDLEFLRKLDKSFAGRAYALLLGYHSAKVCAATPGCRVRLSTDPENPSSHAATFVRMLQSERPADGYVLASEVREVGPRSLGILVRSFSGSWENSSSSNFAVFNDISIRSDGRTLGVFFDEPPSLGERVRMWFRELTTPRARSGSSTFSGVTVIRSGAASQEKTRHPLLTTADDHSPSLDVIRDVAQTNNAATMPTTVGLSFLSPVAR